MVAFKLEGEAATVLENLLFPECLENVISTFDEIEGALIDVAIGEDPAMSRQEALMNVSFLRDMRRDFTKIHKQLVKQEADNEEKEKEAGKRA